MRLLDYEFNVRRKHKMIFKLFSIKDELGGFAPTVPFITNEEAIRYFRTHLEQTPLMISNPEDYSIWYIGTFDSESGTIVCTTKDMKLLERGKGNGNNKTKRNNKV